MTDTACKLYRWRKHRNDTTDSADKLKLDAAADTLNVGDELNDTEKTRRAMGSKFTPDSLLLLTDFNSFCSKKLVREISAWFEGQFIMVNSSDRIRFCPGLPEDDGLGKIGVYIT